MDIPYKNTEGQSFIELIQGTAGGKEYIHGFGEDDNILIASDDWKLLSGNGFKEQFYKLFNCAADPAENINLAGGGPAVIADLTEKSIDQRSKSLQLRTKIMGENDDDRRASLLPAQDNVRVTEEEDGLKALGYLR